MDRGFSLFFAKFFAYIFEYLIDSFIFLARTWEAQLDFEKYHPKNEEKPLQHLPNLQIFHQIPITFLNRYVLYDFSKYCTFLTKIFRALCLVFRDYHGISNIFTHMLIRILSRQGIQCLYFGSSLFPFTFWFHGMRKIIPRKNK